MARPNLSRALLALATPALLGLTAAVMLTPSQAFAQVGPVFGAPGSWAITAENLTGYETQSIHRHQRDGRTFEGTRSRLSLLWSGGGVGVGVHYFIAPSLSLGGVLGFDQSTGTNTYQDNPGTWNSPLPSESRLRLQPRVGYALMFTPSVGLWFRGGVGYERTSRRANEQARDATSRDSFGLLSADVFFVWTPVPHVGLFVGPHGDLSFAGSYAEHNVDNNNRADDWSSNASLQRLALTSGLIAFF